MLKDALNSSLGSLSGSFMRLGSSSRLVNLGLLQRPQNDIPYLSHTAHTLVNARADLSGAIPLLIRRSLYCFCTACKVIVVHCSGIALWSGS